MAIKKITIYWRDIPSQVLIQRGRIRKKKMLTHRFQEAIDRAAMRAGKGSSNAYIAEWKRESEKYDSDMTSKDIDEILTQETASIEKRYTDNDLLKLVRNHGNATT
ncbi:MAG: virulence factor [Woeseiaceae bacterium]|nr:virulence factor [Woeseiaceae bacterium]